MKSEQQKAVEQQSFSDTKEAGLQKAINNNSVLKDNFCRLNFFILFVNVSTGRKQ